jgi:outer membrane receptor for ferrienterochelin and colicins
MKKYILSLCIVMLGSMITFAQNKVRFIISSTETNEVLTGASVSLQGTSIGGIADVNGIVELTNIPNGQQIFIISFVGFEKQKLKLAFPLQNDSPIQILLEPEHEELEEVIITTTRSSRHIENIPTRVEFIGGEELGEKITMQPGNIRMILSESTGIQTQQTSVSSANSTIRIQGLDGRYTQLLKDGFPLYAGFSGGLSIMQIPPLDLQQVDVIKGSASTLYGGGAIAGLVNLISKQPTEEKELSLLVNGTSARGLDLSSYYAQKFEKVGVTLFASHNYNKEYDPAGIGFSAIPNYKRYTINPRLFFYLNDKSTLMVGLNTALEDRIGGDMKVIAGNGDAAHTYFEKNQTNRVSTQVSYTNQVNDNASLTIKNSINRFTRNINETNYAFGGTQFSSFSEVSYGVNKTKSDWVVGGNVWTDAFTEEKKVADTLRSYSSTTIGGFVQNIWTLSEKVSVESGLRVDYALVSARKQETLKDVFALPRVSVLFHLTPKLTSRVGGGLGYKTPTIFTEKTEEQVFNRVRTLNLSEVKSERSYGANVDFNFQTSLGEDWSFSINQLFFFTQIQKPLVFNLDSLEKQVYYFENANGYVDALGTETNIKLGFKDFKLYFGYTFVNAENNFGGVRSAIPLTAKHRINSVLMYEVHEKWRVGLEAFYFGQQKLSTGITTRDYWIVGFSAQRNWEHFSLFVNFENFTDTRQTRFGSIYSGPVTNPQFSEIYAPMDGFVSNMGFILKL